MDIHQISYIIGISVIFISHIYIIATNGSYVPMVQHSYLNLVAALMIAYYYMNKESMITW